jgi:hypothetical protein
MILQVLQRVNPSRMAGNSSMLDQSLWQNKAGRSGRALGNEADRRRCAAIYRGDFASRHSEKTDFTYSSVFGVTSPNKHGACGEDEFEERNRNEFESVDREFCSVSAFAATNLRAWGRLFYSSAIFLLLSAVQVYGQGLANWTYSTNTIVTTPANVSVGIGTTSPQVPLDVNGAAVFNGSINQYWGNTRNYVQWPSAYYSTPSYYMGWSTDAYARRLFIDDVDSDGSAIDPAGGITFRTGSGTPTDRLHIAFSGNVGIGTTSPQHLLHVAGTIGAKEVIVSSTGADYVFDPGYRLLPLADVDAYVNENHHLPDIPSAKEVEEKGVSLGEMQSKLLAKIEELTLHMIQAEKENEALRDRLALLERKIGSPAYGDEGPAK